MLEHYLAVRVSYIELQVEGLIIDYNVFPSNYAPRRYHILTNQQREACLLNFASDAQTTPPHQFYVVLFTMYDDI